MPSMSDYMYMPRGNSVETAPPEDLDVTHLRTNFESNVALPLQNWAAQSFLTNEERATMTAARIRFVDRLAKLVRRIAKDPKLKFMIENNNFLYLCDYLDRSTHTSKPNLLKGPEAERQREALESLVYEVRGLAVKFVHETQIDEIVLRSIRPGLYGSSTCSDFLKLTPHPGGASSAK
jgi:hypothetical protein